MTVLQRFDLIMDDPSYELKVKQTLTIKPDHFYIHAIPRKDTPRLLSVPSSTFVPGGSAAAAAAAGVQRQSAPADTSNLQQLFVLYGSNPGGSKSFAERLASDAPTHGTHVARARGSGIAHVNTVANTLLAHWQASAHRSARSTPSPRSSPRAAPSSSSPRPSRVSPPTTPATS